ncbi:DNA repair protein RecN [Rhodobacteraceae bacterium W635]|uniref:DNA repair protein RecN n=1 Tax=Nioella halotolerans TaxID=2303578 RepID=UPI000E3E8E24|nr:DNA repair protein RecN [Rhodobacteraceae bacterium W635]
MLRSLDIRDMLIIDRLELDFQPGLNVLTGETGAGKSILLDSLGFVLGWRGRAELVRAGADQGEVQAVFDVPPGHGAHAVLDEAGLPGGEELILRRVNTASGRKTAWVNDRRVSGDVLRQLSETLVELHGQQDDRGLLDPRVHRDLLDDFGGLMAMREAMAAHWRAVSSARRALDRAEADRSELQAEEEFLRHAVAELDALDPQPGEEETLDARRRLMQGAEKMRADVARALEAMGAQGGEGALSDALRWLDGLSDKAESALEAPLAALERALVELGEAQDGVETFAEQLSFNPLELEETEERLFALRGLARKHEVLPDDLGRLAQELRARLEALDASGTQLDALRADLAKAREAYDAAAAELGAARREAARQLDARIMQELAPLKMDRAVFETRIVRDEPGPSGMDAVNFAARTNPGAPIGPLNKVASGGELSRFLLAMKVCLSERAEGLTMIFDEIDRGVGGATADAVGRRLKALATGGQVLVVTHSPQVAALGAHHWRVEKRVEGEVTLSRVVPLDAGDRVDEVARMLSGDTVTEAAREAARELLKP